MSGSFRAAFRSQFRAAVSSEGRLRDDNKSEISHFEAIIGAADDVPNYLLAAAREAR